MSIVVELALMHYQFEAIHPFNDGSQHTAVRENDSLLPPLAAGIGFVCQHDSLHDRIPHDVAIVEVDHG